MAQRLSDYHVDHRVIVVEPTPVMQKIAGEMAALQEALSALQVKYRDLEETEQRRQFHAFKKLIRSKGEDRIYKEYSVMADRALSRG